MKISFRFIKMALIIFIMISTIIPIAVLGKINSRASAGTVQPSITKNTEVSLPVIKSFENLKKLLEDSEKTNPRLRYGIFNEGVNFSVAKSGAPLGATSAQDTSSAGSHSTTNVQVQGVDEADIVKNDGKYIYHVNDQRVVIMNAYPVKDMKVESVISYKGQNFNPFEIYVDEKHLVVIGYNYTEIPMTKSPAKDAQKIMPYIRPPYYSRSTIKAIVYDLSDKKNVKQLREIEIEGSYVSSRKIGSNIYFVTNKYIDIYYIMNENSGLDESYITPVYRDSKVKNDYINVPYSNIHYFPGVVEPNYIIVAGLNIDNLAENLSISTYLGSGENIYVSENNLYVAAMNYQVQKKEEVKPQFSGNDKLFIGTVPQYSTNTLVYRFSLKGKELKCTGKGEVPGTILNQFSMDEHNNYFRIATTKGDIWRTDENTSKNNLYILDGEMNIAGKIEDIAPGEKIYSVRFMGNRGYMVTFRTVDPLFVIDLKNPKEPKILGALKIPGYSDYLHPYDENHIIGFGKDAVEVSHKDDYGNTTGTMAYYLGMKVAIFDVTDVANPKEKFKTTIGDRGTDSDLLHNHKALLFSKEKNLLAFPVTVTAVQKQPDGTTIPEYGKFTFQGAYVYNIDLVNGFKLKGAISHISDDEYLKSGDYWYGSNKNIQRIMYMDNVLYTISNNRLMANDMNTLNKLGEIQIPLP